MDKSEIENRNEIVNNIINKLKESAANPRCVAVFFVSVIDSSEESGIEGACDISFTSTMETLEGLQTLNRITVQLGIDEINKRAGGETNDVEEDINVHTHNTTQ